MGAFHHSGQPVSRLIYKVLAILFRVGFGVHSSRDGIAAHYALSKTRRLAFMDHWRFKNLNFRITSSARVLPALEGNPSRSNFWDEQE
jgi:hypothetical protein